MRRVLPLLFVAACGPGLTALEEPAYGGSARTLIVASPGALQVVDRVEVEGGLVLPPLRADDWVVINAYRCPAAVLGLSVGPVTLAEEPNARHPLHLTPDEQFEARYDGQGFSSWTPGSTVTATVQALLARAELPADAGCRRFAPQLSPRPVTIPTSTGGRLALLSPLGPDRVLVVSEEGGFFQLDERGVVTRYADLSTRTPHLALYRAGVDDYWLLGQGRALVRGSPGSGFVEVSPPQDRLPLSVAWLDGGQGPAGLELFAGTDRNQVWRYAGGRWERRFALGRVAETGPYLVTGGLAWTGPDQALSVDAEGWMLAIGILVSPQRPSARVLSEGRAQEVPLTEDPGNDPTALARLPTLGLVAGTVAGDLFRFSEGAWARLPASSLRVAVLALAEWRGGVIYGGRSGAMAHFHPQGGTCAVSEVTPDARAIAPLGEGLVVMSQAVEETTGARTVTVFEPLGAPQDEACR